MPTVHTSSYTSRDSPELTTCGDSFDVLLIVNSPCSSLYHDGLHEAPSILGFRVYVLEINKYYRIRDFVRARGAEGPEHFVSAFIIYQQGIL